jgi:hypothetical protein
MQTFLPYPSFKETAKCLDYKRLGKQRVEAKQIIEILEGKSSGWKNHPAVLMWKGYIPCLKHYFNIISKEWEKRGYKHNIGYYEINQPIIYPIWFGYTPFHDSHKSNLIRKFPEHYNQYFYIENNLPYYWPVKK